MQSLLMLLFPSSCKVHCPTRVASPKTNAPVIAGDLSRNNWWVAALAFGEGWHNNHHAFEFSARHGLEKWQIDITWLVISALQKVGLATNVKLPSERQKSRLAFE